MTTRDHAPLGAPCWADLWTSDVDGSRRFYCELFGWEAQEPSPEFGGYFMFTRDGLPVAGGMGDMGDLRADNSWKIYLDTPDIAKTVAAARAKGGELIGETGEVADLGIQAVLVDPTGATVGAWQAGTFPGFVVLNEHGAPSWFELHTRDFDTAIDFYESVFQWTMEAVGDTDEFRYSTLVNPEGGDMSAGVMDAKGFLPDGVPAHWSVYWEVDDASAAVAQVRSLGGSVVQDAEDTPYGRLATVADPNGAQFKFRQSNA
jgi:predicted enzyme related to lactoylglutathione lyase